jgi:hypothetical protein
LSDFQAEAEWLRQLPLIEALWYAVERNLTRDRHVLKILKERYRLEYEVKGEGRGWKAKMEIV